jgi:uncharacterized iron-regulated membrane protein
MRRADAITRSTANGYLISPDDLWVSPGVRAVFANVDAVMRAPCVTQAYSDSNAIAMSFVPDGTTTTTTTTTGNNEQEKRTVRVQIERPAGSWTDVQAWHEQRDGSAAADYILMLGQRYRVVASSGTGDEEVVFEVRPPYYTDVATVCNRSTSSFAVRFHRMLLGEE